MKRIFVTILTTLALTGLFAVNTVKAVEPPSDDKFAVVISGVEATENALLSYTNVIVGLDGKLGTPSLLLRFNVLHGQYDYTFNAMTGLENDVDFVQGEFTLGYGGVYNGVWLAAYVGVDFQDHDLDLVDITNSVSGTEIGAKVVGEVVKLGHEGIHYSAYGTYSTAFDSYFARLRLGRHINHDLAIGVEGVLLGDDEWDAERLGAYLQTHIHLDFAHIKHTGFLILSGGYQFTDNEAGRADDSEGGYGTLQYKVLY